MISSKEREIAREIEIKNMIRERNIKHSQYHGLVIGYIKKGGIPTAYEICDILEEIHFFHKLKDHKFAKIKRSNMLIKYVKDNFNNIHKILAEIPWSLKYEIDIIYKAISEDNNDEYIETALQNYYQINKGITFRNRLL